MSQNREGSRVEVIGYQIAIDAKPNSFFTASAQIGGATIIVEAPTRNAVRNQIMLRIVEYIVELQSHRDPLPTRVVLEVMPAT